MRKAKKYRLEKKMAAEIVQSGSANGVAGLKDSTRDLGDFLGADGRKKRKANGWNKSEVSSVDADNDEDALTLWINERGARSLNTKANYQREANRLLFWLKEFKGKDLRSITREDLGEYRDFLRRPPLELIGAKAPLDSPLWKPFFVEKPKASTARQSFGVACAIFSWLEDVGYIEVNPAKRLPREKISLKTGRRRAVPKDIMLSVMLSIDEMPRETDLDIRKYWRARWVFNLLRLTGMRISEIQSASMGDVYSEYRGEKLRTFIGVKGKGSKERDVPLIGEIESEFVVYKRSLGLIDNDIPSDVPLVCGLSRKNMNKRLTRQALHNAIKDLVSKAAIGLRSDGRHSEADFLEKVSAHWFRHTYATNLLDSGASIRTGRDNLGHANLSTTSIYSHSDLDARFDETEMMKDLL